MAGKTKKIDKEFLITDSSVNCYGFRLLTEGYLIDEFKRNPIGYHMHDREKGVMVRWEDLRIDGDKVYGKPLINLSNERGQQTVDEIENGFLNGASVGHIVGLEWSGDPNDMMPGQTGPTITKWYNRETSLCDVPGNMNALALFDKEGNKINLTDFKTQNLNMKQIFLTAGQLAKLSLTDAATSADIDTKLDNLAAEAAKVKTLETQLTSEKEKTKKAQDDLSDLSKKTVANTVKTLLETALAEKKMTKEMSDILAVQYAEKPVELKSLIDTMKPYESVVAKTDLSDSDKTELSTLAAMSAQELYDKEKFDRLKELSPAAYKAKYKELFGSDAPEDKK